MKTGRNLQEVLVELDRQNKAKQDFISPAQGMRLREDGHTFELNHLTTDRQMTFGTTSLFHRQVASALGIPAKYYDLMQSQKPELLAENVNAWFADRTSSYMVRSMDYGSGQVARALLSERYRRIDNMEIATSVLPLFAGNDQYEVMSCEVTENRLYLKVVNHRLEMEVRKGDIVQAGVMISNSEVGLGAVSIQPLVYRLVCTNGMVVNDMGERRHHVGRQAKAVEDSFTLYSDETMEAEDKAFLLKLRDTTMAAIDEARFAQVVGRLQESMAVPITGKVQDVVQLSNTSSPAATCPCTACPMQSLSYLIAAIMRFSGMNKTGSRCAKAATIRRRAADCQSSNWIKSGVASKKKLWYNKAAKGVRLMTQCIPIRDLKNTAEISEMCRKSNSPITITKNGYSDMVIMSAEVYERMRLYSVYEKLMQAEDDIAEGRVSDAHSSLNHLRAKYGL